MTARHLLSRKAIVAASVVAVLSAWPAGAAEINLRTGATPELGAFLADSEGRTLYVYAKDILGTSACTGECLEKWPAFFQEQIVPAKNIPIQMSVVDRGGGARQTAFRGWPLYRFAGDAKAGEVNGEGVKGFWFVARVPFYTVMIGSRDGSPAYLVGPQAKALYVAAGETEEAITCKGDCLKSWTPFYVQRLVLPTTLEMSDFQSIRRPDGWPQLAFRGRPLYWYKQDPKMGDTNGASVEGWSLAEVAK